jgi:hypothetical protein
VEGEVDAVMAANQTSEGAMTLYDYALAALDDDIAVLPAKEDGTKMPISEPWVDERGAPVVDPMSGEQGYGWKHRETVRATEQDIRRWYGNGRRTGFGIACGAVSGIKMDPDEADGEPVVLGLEMVEFEQRDRWKEFVETAEQVGLGPLVERIASGYLSETPGGGVHTLIRCKEFGGNDKLARRPATPEELAVKPSEKIKVISETRGQGGFTVEPPSHGRVHPSGQPYRMLRGGLSTICVIRPSERKALLDLIRTFDEMPEDVPVSAESKVVEIRGAGSGSTGLDVIEEFNRRTSWDELLGPLGWRPLRSLSSGVTIWRRPGKTEPGGSATTNYGGSDRLVVFTTSTDFEATDRAGAKKAYSKFAAYAHINHLDFGAAVKQVAEQMGMSGRQAGKSLGRIRMNGHGGGESEDRTLPEIYADEQDLRVITGEAWDALAAANEDEPFLFRQGGALVRVETADGGKPIFRELALSVARHELARAAVWWGMRGPKAEKVRKVVVPPDVVCQDVLATPSPPLPEVIRITESPVFGPDWAIRITSGYHASARAYCAIPDDIRIPLVAEMPTPEDVARATALILHDLFGDFPFEKPADQAHAVALFLQPFVRDAINGPTPLHVVESPTMGTGKGLLVDAALRPSCGRGVAVMAQCRDGDEWRKRITAALRGGHAAVQIDNVTLALDSGELAMAITIPYWSDRLLGSSQTVSYPVRCAWALTANNPVLSTEMARRSIRIRLDSKTDRPWEREQFRHKELMGWVDDHRGELIWAGLTMVRSWVNAGCKPHSGKALGSFEAWSRVIGGILEHIGMEGFLGNLSEFYEVADTEGAALRSFIDAWWDEHGRDRVGVAELFQIAVRVEGISLGQGNDNSQKAEFGRLLAKQRDRVIGEFTVKHAGKVHGSQKWTLVKSSDELL